MNKLPSIQIILNNVQEKKSKYYCMLNDILKQKLDNYNVIFTIMNSDGLVNIINNKKLTVQTYNEMLNVRFINESPIVISNEYFQQNDIIYI